MTDEEKSIEQLMGLIFTTTDVELQNRLWTRVDALTDKIVGLKDRLVCDVCGETFEPEADVEEDVAEQAKEAGWIDDEKETYCPAHRGYHPDHIETDYGRPVLE